MNFLDFRALTARTISKGYSIFEFLQKQFPWEKSLTFISRRYDRAAKSQRKSSLLLYSCFFLPSCRGILLKTGFNRKGFCFSVLKTTNVFQLKHQILKSSRLTPKICKEEYSVVCRRFATLRKRKIQLQRNLFNMIKSDKCLKLSFESLEKIW